MVSSLPYFNFLLWVVSKKKQNFYRFGLCDKDNDANVQVLLGITQASTLQC